MANDMPALLQASAAFRCVSQVHSSISGMYSALAGYIFITSMPAALFRTLARAHGPFACAPQLDGTARQCPSARARYSARLLTLPFLVVSRCTTSSIGTSL